MKTFKDFNLNKALFNALDDLDIVTPTKIQEESFSIAMSGKDLIGIAQTGTGKTIAYLLPCLRLWKFSKDKAPQILILVPTRELVVQVVEQVEELTTYMNVVVKGIYGESNINKQKQTVDEGLDILVATPGRLLDLALDGILKMKSIKKLIIDEVDEMLNLGFRPQLNNILDLLSDERQNLMFSATMTDEIEKLLKTYFRNPIKIEAAPAGSPLENITQLGYELPNFYSKINFTKHLISQEGFEKVLIFTDSKKIADVVFEELAPSSKDDIEIIHSNKAQNARFQAVKNFMNGETRVLVATDVISRGLDIAGVSHVINFNMPDNAENYIHRIGRTGRANQTGIAITYIGPKDGTRKLEIEVLMEKEISVEVLPEEVELTDELAEHEQPKHHLHKFVDKVKRAKPTGAGEQEKKAKNKKVVNIKSYKEEIKSKYKKPQRKGNKKK
ncbi:MAG: DEAD/DEAH box helicase [Reichenbachiella sp.]